MYYDVIKIRPSGNKWVAEHYQLDGDREPLNKYVPNALGFFYFPRKLGVKKWFDTLKKEMIKRHEYEIESLKKSLCKLRMVSEPKYKK